MSAPNPSPGSRPRFQLASVVFTLPPGIHEAEVELYPDDVPLAVHRDEIDGWRFVYLTAIGSRRLAVAPEIRRLVPLRPGDALHSPTAGAVLNVTGPPSILWWIAPQPDEVES